MLKLFASLALARAARKHADVDAGIGRALVGLVAPWLTPTLRLRRGERVIEADPVSLGLLFEDTDYCWWWVRTTVSLPVFTAVFVDVRGKRAAADMGPRITSGDAAFDARFVVARHPSIPECHDVATSIIASAAVRRLLVDLLPRDNDSCTLGTHISLTRHRTTASFDDALTQMERVADLAAAMEAVFVESPYR